MKKVLLLLAISSILFSYSQEQITDFQSQSGDMSSNPRDWFKFNDLIFFSAETEHFGREIWVTDGTPNNAVLLKDIFPGAENGILFFQPVILNGEFYFYAEDGYFNTGLWKSDGTREGTTKVIDLFGQKYDKLTVVNDQLFFLVDDKLLKSNGTKTGTFTIKENIPVRQVYFQTEFNGLFIFTIGIESSNESRMWRSDGTEAGTFPISPEALGPGGGFDSSGTGNFTQYTKFENNLYFVIRSSAVFGANSVGIMRTDGTEKGTVPIKGIHPGNTRVLELSDAIVLNDKIYFFFFEEDLKRIFIWETNGTENNTTKILDYSGTNYFLPSVLSKYQNSLLYFSEGSNGGPALVKLNVDTLIETEIIEFSQEPTDPPPFVVPYRDIGFIEQISADRIFVSFVKINGFSISREGYVVNLTDNTFTKIENVDSIYYSEYFFDNSNLYLKKFSSNIRYELWKSELIQNSTFLLDNINKSKYGINPYFKLSPLNGKLMFHADDGINGIEPWAYNNSNNNLELLKDINAGQNSSIPNYFDYYINTIFVYDNKYYFQGDDGNVGRELWESDGTGAGTTISSDIFDEGGSTPSHFSIFDNNLHFVAYLKNSSNQLNAHLIKKQGSSITPLVDFGVDPFNNSYDISQLTTSGNFIYFTFITGEIAIRRTDGTQNGTIVLKNFSEIGKMIDVNGTLFFTAESSDHPDEIELYMSDGSPNGTVLVKNIEPGFSSNPNNLTNNNGILYFTAKTSSNGREIWRSDGTVNGTFQIKDINSNSDSSIQDEFHQSSEPLAVLSNEVYFEANDGIHGIELWKTDGTEQGTQLVKDIQEGSENSNPSEFELVNNILYFQASDDLHGNELWRTDGTESGTFLVSDILKGEISSNPLNIVNIGEDLFFTAETGDSGKQVWKLENFGTLNISENIKKKQYMFYPNPVENVFHINSNITVEGDIQIYNTLGQLIKKCNVGAANSVNISDLQNGVYIISFHTNGVRNTKKLIKK